MYAIRSYYGNFEAEVSNNKEEEKDEYKFRIVGIVCSYVNRFYVEPDRIKPKEMLKEALSGLERVIPEVQVTINEETEEAEILVDQVASYNFV